MLNYIKNVTCNRQLVFSNNNKYSKYVNTANYLHDLILFFSFLLPIKKLTSFLIKIFVKEFELN